MKRALAALAILPLLGQLAAGQEAREPAGPHAPIIERRPPAEIRADQLDGLFARLHMTSSPDEAKIIEAAIWDLWMKSDSSTAEVLLGQAVKAMGAQELDAALKILDGLVEVYPDFAEAWNKRATVYFMLGRMDNSLADVARVLELEPRHFGALAGLGMIKREKGDIRGALAAFKQALAIDPNLEAIEKTIDELEHSERAI